MKLIKAIPMSPVIIKVIPRPRSGAGIFEYIIMTSARIFKIKPGKKDEWQHWCHKIATTHKDEAIDTLKEENIMHEMFVIFSLDGEDYTIGFSQESEGQIAQSTDIDDPLNQKHRDKKHECLEPIDESDVSIGYSLYNL
jgi:hypothetical protein